MTDYDCEGKCKEHRGRVKRVTIRDGNTGRDWGEWHYCEAAIETDKERGLLISAFDEEDES